MTPKQAESGTRKAIQQSFDVGQRKDYFCGAIMMDVAIFYSEMMF